MGRNTNQDRYLHLETHAPKLYYNACTAFIHSRQNHIYGQLYIKIVLVLYSRLSILKPLPAHPTTAGQPRALLV